MVVAAGAFKARCLSLMDQVQKRHTRITITKRGKPVARLVPVDDPVPVNIIGCMKGTFEIVGDVVSPTGEKWEADSDE